MATLKYGELLTADKHKEFDYVLSGVGDMPDYQISQLRTGDLILRKVNKPHNPFYHVGVYCGGGEIIEFTVSSEDKRKTSMFASVSSASDSRGSVSKVGLADFFKGQKYHVARCKYGTPPDFSQRVMKAMMTRPTDRPRYNAVTNNCLDFALKLLGLK